MIIVFIEDIRVASPQRQTDMVSSKLLPRECRELGISYSGVMTVTLRVQVYPSVTNALCMHVCMYVCMYVYASFFFFFPINE
jgi:DNA-directed RNA polymerase beta subunit